MSHIEGRACSDTRKYENHEQKSIGRVRNDQLVHILDQDSLVLVHVRQEALIVVQYFENVHLGLAQLLQVLVIETASAAAAAVLDILDTQSASDRARQVKMSSKQLPIRLRVGYGRVAEHDLPEADELIDHVFKFFSSLEDLSSP